MNKKIDGVEFKHFISREEVRNNRDIIYVYGDNLQGVGYGGQAKEMRGEPNTIGIPTKISPSKYFTDDDYYKAVTIILSRFQAIYNYLLRDYTVVIPSAGIGTGRAKLAEKAPKIWKVLKERLESLGWEDV